LDEGNPVRVERGELRERLGGEVVCIVEQLGHGGLASQETGGVPDRALISRGYGSSTDTAQHIVYPTDNCILAEVHVQRVLYATAFMSSLPA
jgi:hypothetical protein